MSVYGLAEKRPCGERPTPVIYLFSSSTSNDIEIQTKIVGETVGVDVALKCGANVDTRRRRFCRQFIGVFATS